MTDQKLTQALSHPILGAHFSIAKGLHNAVYTAQKYGCNTLQLFTKNARSWKERQLTDKEVALFKAAVAETGITAITSHTSYLINLAAADPKKQTQSTDALARELVRSSMLGLPFVVLHPGTAPDADGKSGIDRIIDSINRIFDTTPAITCRLLLETTAGQGNSIGHRFEQIATMLQRIKPKNQIGVCLDTAHVFAAGYDLRGKDGFNDTMRRFDDALGFKNLYLIHLNDSKKDLGSRVDRHDHIGRGKIGKKGFSLIMNDERLIKIPKILETPKLEKGRDMDKVNLDLLRSLATSDGSPNQQDRSMQ